MGIPDRVKLGAPFGSGIGVGIGISFLVSISLFAVLAVFNILVGSWVFVAMLLAIPLMIGASIDHKSRERRYAEQLDAMGFEACSYDSLDPDLTFALRNMKPIPLDEKSFQAGYRGLNRGVEAILTKFEIGSDESTSRYAACAIWSPIDLPNATIRRRRFKDRISTLQSSDASSVGEYHILESDDEQLVKTILELSDWFHLKAPRQRSFRISSPPPGSKECWSLNGHWIVYTDLGNPNPESMIELTEFLAAFVMQFELQYSGSSESIPVNSDS